MKNSISEKQLKANKKNAQQGGVKTSEGKEVSKYNALKHGILSDIITKYDPIDFNELFKSLVDEFDPVSTIEWLLVERIALCQLRLYRAAKAENQHIKRCLNSLRIDFDRVDDEDDKGPKLNPEDVEELCNLYLRYEKTLENRFYRALHELERVQRTRKGENVPPPLALDVGIENK